MSSPDDPAWDPATHRQPTTGLIDWYARAGRFRMNGWAWLARLADKARAEKEGTLGDYIVYCPLSLGFLHAAGVSQHQFDLLISRGITDVELVRYFDTHADAEHKAAANHFILVDSAAQLDELDAEENYEPGYGY